MNHLKSLLTVLIVSICTLVSLEIGLRIVGYSLLLTKSHTNGPDDIGRNSKSIRILALGESTTATFFSPSKNGAWPERMESLLRRRGYDVKVFNEGLGGTTTPFILRKAPDYFEKYRPHIVIAMMGTNDDSSLALSNRYEEIHWFSDLRLIKLFKWTKLQLEQQSKKRPKAKGVWDNQSYPNNFWGKVEVLRKRSETHPAERIIEDIEAQFKNEEERAAAYEALGVHVLNSQYNSESHNRSALQFFKRGFELDASDMYIAFDSLGSAIQVADSQFCEAALETLSEYGRNLPDNVIYRLAICSRFVRDDQKRTQWLEQFGIELEQEENPTKKNYRILAHLVMNQNALLIAMQYPTKPVAQLKEYFEPELSASEHIYKNIVFVSNELNFNDALRKHKYEDVFVDRLRGSWGHTTDFGNQLIAESVGQEVEKLIRTKFK